MSPFSRIGHQACGCGQGEAAVVPLGKLWGYEVCPGSQKKEWASAFESKTRKLQDPIIFHAESILTKAEGNTLPGLAGSSHFNEETSCGFYFGDQCIYKKHQ